MPLLPPDFSVPPGAVAQVSIIDSTTSISNAQADFLIVPPLKGLDRFNEVPSWSFLIESEATGQKALFDLGVMPNWRDLSPVIADILKKRDWIIEANQHVAEILQNHQIPLESINSVIWSHYHWDHLGDPSTFPSATELVVGPGFKDAFFPGWPVRNDSPVRESDFKGRELREISFEPGSKGVIQIGRLGAFDFFGDGSFYLLDTPGHAVGHLGGLVRTTQAPETFMLLGGDLCHYNGEIRPSPYLRIPEKVHLLGFAAGSVCPGSVFESFQTARNRSLDQPFFDPPVAFSMPDLKETIKKTQEADAQSNVLFVYAHDRSIRGVVDLFPCKANDWKTKGWKGELLWKFLEDFKDAVSIQQQKSESNGVEI